MSSFPNLSGIDNPEVRITMCRYSNEKFERLVLSTHDTKYIAISHSWGSPTWRRIQGAEGEIWASEERAAFIQNRLPSIIGDNYFWMDIMCVDQRNQGANISVPKHIPPIFRHAERTLILRDGAGFRDCCIQAVGDFDSWSLTEDEEHTTARCRLADHCQTVHASECLNEGVLSRLWVYQEVLLSDNIQFVRDGDEIIQLGSDKYFPDSVNT
jgi:hypothetical protein